MKILAFDVRDDEEGYFRELENKHGIAIARRGDSLTEDTVSAVEGYDAVTVLGMSMIDGTMLDSLKERGIKYLSTRTIGYNHIDAGHAAKIGLPVFNAGYDPHGVADYTIMLMLMTMRNYKQALYRASANDYSLKGLIGREMRDMTVGVIGTGRIGAQVVRNLQGFGCEIIAFDQHKNSALEGLAQYVDTLEELYKRSDIITLHTPLLESTHHMINRETIAMMKDGVILINCARGQLISLEALIDGIESRKIGAVGLDVVEEEEGIYHRDLRSDIIINRNMAYVRQFPNVTMTQHMAFYTERAVDSMVRCGVESFLEYERTGASENEIR